MALTAERGVRSAAHARERDEQRKAHASITNDRQRREHRRRELREAIHAAWNTPEELSALLSEESVDEIGPKSAPRALPERVTALLRETREIAAASNKLANTAAKVAMRASFETDGEGDAAALAGPFPEVEAARAEEERVRLKVRDALLASWSRGPLYNLVGARNCTRAGLDVLGVARSELLCARVGLEAMLAALDAAFPESAVARGDETAYL